MKLIIPFLFKPYTNRLKLGEGGLVIFNLANSIYAHFNIGLILMEFFLSFLVLCALYGYNDFVDRKKDGFNDKKDKGFVLSIVQNESMFISLNILLTATTIILTLLLRDWVKLEVVILLYIVNFLYSNWFKTIPVADIVLVIIWGGLYVVISGSFQWEFFFIAGIMTGIAHLFQIMTDRVSDGITNIKTTVVSIPGSEKWFLAGLCFLLGAFLFSIVGFWWSLSAAFPLLIYGFSKQVALSWHFSRVYFFICWLSVLTLLYGSH